jgi:multidrug efflux system membrane fusion protein
MAVRSIVHGWGIVAACAVAACEGDFTAAFSPPDRTPIPVHVETVSSERSRPALVVTGVVEAKSTRTLGFPASGRIARFHVEQGARVAAGDAIAEFDLAQLEAEQRSARTNLVRTQARRLEAARHEGRRRRLLELAAVAPASVAPPGIESLLYEAEVRYAQALVERRRLVFGGFDGDRVAVVTGLAVGDRVVTHGHDLVTVGDAVGIIGEGL